MAFGAEVANLIVALKLDDSGFSGKINKAARQLKAMDAGMSQMGRGAGQLAGGLARVGERAAIAAAGGLAAVVTTAASFEQAFTGVEKTVDGTDAQMAELEETIRSMARSMPVSFEELAAIGESGGALGVARESLDEFIDVVARLSVSTNLSSEQAATALGQLGNVLHLEGAELEEFADTLVALGNAGASTEDQIVEMAARFGAAGNSAGLTSDEILALSSAVASMGIEVEAGGSSLSRLFNNVTTGIGTNSKEAQKFADAIGLSMGEFKKSWEDDALGTFQDLLATLNELDQFEAAALLKDIGITNTRDVNTIRLMAQNMGFVGEQLQVAADAQGALDKESQKFFDTTTGQWKTFINIMRDAAAIIGTEVLPVTKDLLTDLSAGLNNPETREALKAFGQDLADGVRGFIDEMKGTDFSGIIGGLKLTAEVAKGAFDAFRSLPAPIQQLAIAALVANKVTGGAIGQIAAGLGNLVLGSLKTITATHVTVVGGTVTGGPGGVPGGGGVGGSIAKGLKVGAALGSIPLAGAAAVEVINFSEMREQAIGGLEEKLDAMDRGTFTETKESMAKIQAEIDKERPFLEGILFNTNVKPVLERELSELQQVKQGQYRVADKTQALEGLARSAQNYYSRTASASERTAAKDFSLNPELNVHTNLSVPVSVSVNASVIAQQLYRARTSVRTTDGIHHSGGFV
jgi:TP901 family phage tail tape measure protein